MPQRKVRKSKHTHEVMRSRKGGAHNTKTEKRRSKYKKAWRAGEVE